MSFRELRQKIYNIIQCAIDIAEQNKERIVVMELSTIQREILALLDGFEKDLRRTLKFATMYKLPSDYPRDAKLIIRMLGVDSDKKESMK